MLGGVEVGLERVERQHPDQAIADEQRDGHPALDAPRAEGIHEVREPLGDVRDDDRLAPLDHLAGGILGPPYLVAHAEQFVDVRIAMAADDHQLVAVELLDAGTCIGDNFAQLRQNHIEDFGHTECAPERFGRRAQRLGLLAGGVLGREQPSFSIAIAAWAAKAVASSASSSL